MRIYEELFIVRPDAAEEEIDALIEQLKSVITQSGGTLDKVDKWGVRKLAYRVKKRDEGFYILLVLSTGAQTVRELERRLRVSDMVLKYLTVRIDEKLQWLEKRKKIREKRAARRPAPVVPAPALAPAMPGAPGAHAVPGLPAEPAAPAPGPAPAPPPPAEPTQS
jgi:small subunit ribosomal protein S6